MFDDTGEAPKTATILRVMPTNVTELWPQIEPLIIAATDGPMTHTTDDVRRELMASHAELWIQWSDRVEAACVTRFMSHPRGLWLRIWLLGAAPMVGMDWPGFRRLIEIWGRAHNCVEMEFHGRLGWARKFPDARVIGIVARVPFSYEVP